MECNTFELKGLILLTPRVFSDERGFFFEAYSERSAGACGIGTRFVQDNQSRSRKNVLRGLHFQKPPHAQDKFVRVVKGEVLDVAVDLRVGSPTYRKWVSVRLSEEKKSVFFIPKGFAHGFLALTDGACVEYKVSDFYNAASEGGIAWNDPEIGVDWGVTDPILSEKDRTLPLLKEIEPAFLYGA